MAEKDPLLNMRNLEAFLAVQRTKSFSLAGKALGIAQPTVTQRVQTLEHAMGVQLFDRRPREVQLTPTGASLFTYAERIIETRDEMIRSLNGHADAEMGTLRIAASSTPGDYVMPMVLQGFHHDYPGVRIQMSVTDSNDVLERLFDGDAELGMVGDCAHDRRLISEAFLDDEIVVIGRPNDPLMGDGPLEPSQLLDKSWIVREAGSATRRAVEAVLTRVQRGAGLRIAMELNSTEAIKTAVRLGVGVALVSRRAVEGEVISGVLATRQIGVRGLRREICAVRVRGRSVSSAARLMWDRLVGPAAGRRLRKRGG